MGHPVREQRQAAARRRAREEKRAPGKRQTENVRSAAKKARVRREHVEQAIGPHRPKRAGGHTRAERKV